MFKPSASPTIIKDLLSLRAQANGGTRSGKSGLVALAQAQLERAQSKRADAALNLACALDIDGITEAVLVEALALQKQGKGQRLYDAVKALTGRRIHHMRADICATRLEMLRAAEAAEEACLQLLDEAQQAI